MTAGDLVTVHELSGKFVFLTRPFGFDERTEVVYLEDGSLGILLTEDEDEELCRILIDGQRMHVSRSFLRQAS
jgi:hypothetical protein